MESPIDPLLAALKKSGQLAPEQCAAAERIWADAGNDSGRLGEMLRAADILTVYQFRKMKIGRTADLLFGKYLIFDKIGEGGMGKVYRAADTNLARLVALKVVRPSLLANKTVLKRYKREAQATATLDHPNIVHLYDADEANGRHFMAMEYVDGSDLARLVKEHGPLGSAEACEYIRQAALGLHHAHEKGFVHRDIKPSNLLVYGERAGSGGKAMLKILDMGLVRSLADDDNSLADLTRDNTVVGTPDFMSPEQASDSRSVDGRSDLYSLGCALFYLISGKPPYREANTIAKLLAHQRDPIPDLASVQPDVPAGVAGIASKLLAKKRDARFQSGAELAEALLPFTSEGARQAIRAPAAILRSATKTLGRSTLTPVRATVAAITPMRVETPEEIARPNFDLLSSPSLVLDEDIEPTRSGTKKRGGFPVWAMVALGLLCVALPFGALAILSRPKPTEAPGPPTIKKAVPPTTPAEPPKPQFRPLRELLPSDTAAILVYFARPFWDAEEPNLPKTLRANLDSLGKTYGFDPRWFDRGIVAFQPNANKFVACGEGAALNAEWLGDFEKAKGRTVAPADPHGIRSVRYNRAIVFVPNEDKVVGALLPTANGSGAILLSDSLVEMNGLVNRIRAKVAPTEISVTMFDSTNKLSRTQPLATFMASGTFEIPQRGEGEVQTLGSRGVDLFTATFQFSGKWAISLDLAGKDETQLREFLDQVLPLCFDGASPQATAFAQRLRASAKKATATTEGTEKHLKVTLTVESASMNAMIEHFLK